MRGLFCPRHGAFTVRAEGDTRGCVIRDDEGKCCGVDLIEYDAERHATLDRRIGADS